MKLYRSDLFLVVAAGFLLMSLGVGALPSPIAYSNIPFPVHPAAVANGQTVAMGIVRCNAWPVTITYEVDWGLRRSDGLRLDLPNSFVTAPPSTCQSGDSVQQIPFGTPPGEYRIGRVATVHTLLGTTYSVPSESVAFTVTP